MTVKVTTRKRKASTAVMLDYHDGNGKRHQRIVGRASTPDALALVMAEANREAKRIEYELVEGKHRPACGKLTIDQALVEFYEHLDASKVTKSTKDMYRPILGAFRDYVHDAGAIRLKDISPTLIVGFIRSLEGKANNTIGNYIIRINRFLGRCVDRGDMQTNPCRHSDVRDVRPTWTRHERIFSDDELTRFLATVRTGESPDADEYADFFLMLSETGLRVTEGIMLRWADVNLKDGFLRIAARADWKPKTRSSVRTVPLTANVKALLRKRLEAIGGIFPNERVFPAYWKRNGLGYQFRVNRKRAGLDALDDKGQLLTIHSLRHTFASTLVRRGANPATIRDLMGHESITTTNRYFTNPRDELYNAMTVAFGDSDSRHKNVTDSSGSERFEADSVTDFPTPDRKANA